MSDIYHPPSISPRFKGVLENLGEIDNTGLGFNGYLLTQSGLLIQRDYNVNVGPFIAYCGSASDGENPSLFNNAILPLNTLIDPPTSGIVYLTMASGNKILLTYTGVSESGGVTQLLGCTFMPGPVGGEFVTAPTTDTISGFISVTTYSETIQQLFGSAININDDITVNYNGGPFGNSIASPSTLGSAGIINVSGTVTYNGVSNGVSDLLGIFPIYQNEIAVTNENGQALDIVAPEGFVNSPYVIADGAACSSPLNGTSGVINNKPGSGQGWGIGFWDAQIYETSNGGTLDNIESVGYYSAGNASTGVTIVQHVGYIADDFIGGTGATVDQKIGVAIGALQPNGLQYAPFSTATSSIGLLNASTTALVPNAVTVVADFTLTPTSSCIALESTASVSASTTAAVLPKPESITYNGVTEMTGDGQVITLVNANATGSAYDITFTSGTTELLSLGAATRVLAPGGSLTLIYVNTFGRWVEVAFNPGGN